MNINKFFKELSIQDYITFGYLYLVVLGTINIVIYYSSFDINIFDYIAVTDILLAPINMLFLDYEFTGIIIIFILLLTFISKFILLAINGLIENIGKKFNKTLRPLTYQPVLIFVILFSYIFLVLSINMAEGVSLKIKNKTYSHSKTLIFTDNTQKDAYVFATTSVYIFFIVKGEELVTIMPISGNIKSIKKIKR